jgi:hypothetical protein
MSDQVTDQKVETNQATDQKVETKKATDRATKFDIKHWVVIYIHEFLEVFISILIIRIAMDKQIDMYKIIQASAAIGFITFILENYNSDFKSNIKQGITFSVGSQMMSSFMN